MCGICGSLGYNSSVSDSDIAVIKNMNKVQEHRGPDDCGVFHDSLSVLGHQRLSIIDLSKDGHQPFASTDGRYQLVYNGEIYNYIELRQELSHLGHHFLTKTDTEVLLASFIQYGPDCLSKLNGMFAFAIYDTKNQSLFLARDRMGIKPLYYVEFADRWYFASEIKALKVIPQLKTTINHQSLFDYTVFNRTDIFDETFYNEVKRLPKGHYATLSKQGLHIHKWWHPTWFIDSYKEHDFTYIHQKIEELLTSSVKFRMRSDVPVGSCLSGGLDSTILTGILYQHQLAQSNYQTFTSSYPNDPIDETSYVDKLNNKYPFTNHRTTPTEELAFSNLKNFVYLQDEPVTGPSVYSQYEVMRLAKSKQVTVLLDGQGGDENFAGYQYFHGFYLHGLLKNFKIGSFTYELFKVLLRKQHISAYQTLLFQILPDTIRRNLLYKSCPYLEREFFNHGIEKSLIYSDFFNTRSLNDSLARHFQYKLEHLLRFEDRNSMAFSLEARVPYLDHRLVEFLLSLPDQYKIKAGHTKHLQKQALAQYTIPEIANRIDKIGFAVPQEKWMQSQIWQNLTQQSYQVVQELLPGILKAPFDFNKSSMLNWKLCQLATWLQI